MEPNYRNQVLENYNELEKQLGGSGASEKTAKLQTDKSGNVKSLDHLEMKGDMIYNFVIREVPPMIDNLLLKAGKTEEDIDYFMFHQPNKFMLEKLAEILKIPYEKMPNNICEKYGIDKKQITKLKLKV